MSQEHIPDVKQFDQEYQVIGNPEENKGIRMKDIENAIKCGCEIVTIGLDGTSIRIRADNNNLEIYEGIFYFVARLINNEYVTIGIRNKRGGEKSNNIFPSLLLEYALKQWQDRVKKVICCWNTKGGTNTDAYMTAVSKGVVPVQAALQTWSGRILTKLGFSHIAKIDTESDNWIYVHFTTPTD